MYMKQLLVVKKNKKNYLKKIKKYEMKFQM